MSGSVEYLQWDRGGGELVLEVGRRQARSGEAGLQTVFSWLMITSLVLMMMVVAVLGTNLVLLLVVEEVASRTIGAVSSDPVLLTPLGLVLAVLANIPHLLFPMSELTEVSVQTMTFLLEVSADLSLEPGVLVREVEQL